MHTLNPCSLSVATTIWTPPEYIPDPSLLSFPHPAFLQFIFQFAPRSSQVCARRKFAEAAGAPRRPHRGGTGREQSSPVLLPLRQPVRLLGSSRCLVPFSHPRSLMPNLTLSLPLSCSHYFSTITALLCLLPREDQEAIQSFVVHQMCLLFP